MNQQELKAQIDKVCETLTAELPKASPEDARFGALALIGVALLGEMLLDIKRIADAAERRAL